MTARDDEIYDTLFAPLRDDVMASDEFAERLLEHLRGELTAPPGEMGSVERAVAVRPGRSRRRWLFVAAAALLVIVIGVVAVVRTGGDDSHQIIVQPTPSTRPTPTTPCPPLDGADVRAKQSSGSAANALNLRRVQVQASDCRDAVLFTVDALPKLVLSYQPGPFQDGSGRPVTVAGNAFLVVRFDTATTDSRPAPQATDIHIAGPSGIREVREVQGVDNRMTWVIGLDAKRPFRLAPSIASFAIEFGTTGGRRPSLRCTNRTDHVQIQIPAGWFTEMSDKGPCQYVNPSTFTIADGPLDQYLPHITLSPEPFTSPPTTVGQNQQVIAQHNTVIDGRSARVTEIEGNGTGKFANDRFVLYTYAIDWAPHGTLTVSVLGPEGGYDANKTAVDAIARSAHYIP